MRLLKSPGRWWYLGAALLGVCLAAGGVLLRGARSTGLPPESPWLQEAPSRALEARVSHPRAGPHRPYSPLRSAEARPSTAVSLQVLASLEAQGDVHGIATAYLLQGQYELAEAYLEQAGDSPEVSCDRAILALSRKDYAQGLVLLEKVLRAREGYPPALWNRGLALQGLELWALAAESFEAVAALGEPGWSEEARTRAEVLRSRLHTQQQAWRAARAAGDAFVRGTGTLSPELLRGRPDLFRLYLYDAIRVAPTPQRLRALWPIAEALDAHFGGSALRDALQWAEARDLQRRAPLAELYLSIFDTKPVPGGLPSYLEKLRSTQERDILMGTLVLTKSAGADAEGYARLAAQTRDAWFLLIAEHERAKAAISRGELLQAEQRLLAAVEQCRGGTLAYRCGMLLAELGEVYRQLHRLPESNRSVLEARALHRRGGWWGSELDFLIQLGQNARLQGQSVLARALLYEALARAPKDCGYRHFIHANEAAALLRELRLKESREAMDRAIECGGVQSLSGAMTLADLARLRPEPEQDLRLEEGLAAQRRAGSLPPGALAMASHIEGRFAIEQERARGERLLRRALTEASLLPRTNVDARKARAYSYTSLLLAAGKAGEWPHALELFTEEFGRPLPSRCLLAVTVDDERTFVLAVDSQGRLEGHYDASRTVPLGGDVRGVVPESLVARLRSCERVEVVARPPLQGQAGLLPVDLAWAYFARPVTDTPAPSRPLHHLVVKDIEAPASLALPRLGSWMPVGKDMIVLSGAEATPGRVLEAMSQATEIEIHAHGLVNPTLSEASLLVLSPDARGQYALTVSEVRSHRLEAAPLVILAACRAAHTAPRAHEPFSLPVAFLEAGARTVLAATEDIPDMEATPFFSVVRERIRNGQSAAVTVRDVRMEWLRENPDSWVRSVLVFE